MRSRSSTNRNCTIRSHNPQTPSYSTTRRPAAWDRAGSQRGQTQRHTAKALVDGLDQEPPLSGGQHDTGETDAAARLAQLTGEPLPDDDVEFGEEDIAAGEQPAEAEAGQQEPEDDDSADDAVVEQPSADETPAGDAEIEPVSDSTEPAALTEPTEPTASPEDEEAGGVDTEAGPAADDDVPSSAADPVVTDPVVTDPGVTDPVVTDPAVVDAGAMSDPRGTDGPAGR